MRLAALALVVLASAACGGSRFGDAGPDAVDPLPLTTYDVGDTPTGGQPPICPGELYGRASQNRAVCTHPPESCISDTTSASYIACSCSGTGDTGTWECHEAQR